jgi:hypothetical protein
MINLSESFNLTDSESGVIKQDTGVITTLKTALGDVVANVSNYIVPDGSKPEAETEAETEGVVSSDIKPVIVPLAVPLADAVANQIVTASQNLGAPVAPSSGSQNGGFDIDDANSKYWEMKYYKYKSKYFKEKERQNTL